MRRGNDALPLFSQPRLFVERSHPSVKDRVCIGMEPQCVQIEVCPDAHKSNLNASDSNGSSAAVILLWLNIHMIFIFIFFLLNNRVTNDNFSTSRVERSTYVKRFLSRFLGIVARPKEFSPTSMASHK